MTQGTISPVPDHYWNPYHQDARDRFYAATTLRDAKTALVQAGIWSTITNHAYGAYGAHMLAAVLARFGVPHRSKTAITRIRRERAKLATTPTSPRPVWVTPLAQRVIDARVHRYTTEIRRRGGETGIVGDRSTTTVHQTDRRDGLVVLHAEGWRHYSARAGDWHASLSYLCGHDDAGDWAVRVPGTITTVQSALDWLEPADVTQARTAGRQVDRQGDVYAVQTTRAYDGTGTLPPNHHWDPTTRTLTHTADPGRGTHAPLTLTHPVRFVTQRTYQMGRTTFRGAAD